MAAMILELASQLVMFGGVAGADVAAFRFDVDLFSFVAAVFLSSFFSGNT